MQIQDQNLNTDSWRSKKWWVGGFSNTKRGESGKHKPQDDSKGVQRT